MAETNAKPWERADGTGLPRTESGQSWLLASTAFILLVAVACGSSPSPSQGTVPPELQGRWVTMLVATNEQVTLMLTDSRYQIDRGVDSVTGAAAVNGAQIQFSVSSACVGTGIYQWSLNGGSLLFTKNSDPCPGRAEAVDHQTYRRAP